MRFQPILISPNNRQSIFIDNVQQPHDDLAFGHKATNKIIESNISQSIKDELMNAKVYAEGRGIRIDINDDKIISDIETLIDIKLGF